MTGLIDKEIIEKLYTKYDIEGDGRDGWDVAADIINELVPRKEHLNDPEYFFLVHSVFQMTLEYVASTHEVVNG